MTEVNHEIFILGAGGMARETLDIYIDLGKEKNIKGFLEENCQRKGKLLNGKEIQDISYLEKLSKKEERYLIAAIGSTKRKRLIESLEDKRYKFDTVIHPNATFSKWVKIGEGSIVTAGTVMTCQIEIGRHVILNLGTLVCHDATIGDYTTLSPGVKVMGYASIGKEVYVGTNATIREKVKIADGAIVAAGAVVTQDVPEMALVAGIPAKVKKVYKNIEEKPW